MCATYKPSSSTIISVNQYFNSLYNVATPVAEWLRALILLTRLIIRSSHRCVCVPFLDKPRSVCGCAKWYFWGFPFWWSVSYVSNGIRKTCPCNEYPLKPHFYMVKLGYAGVYLIVLFLLQNIDCGYLLEPTIYVLEQK